MNHEEARRAIDELCDTPRDRGERDPEQEVHGAAVAVLDAVIVAVKGQLPDHEVAAAMPDAISPDAVTEGEPIRAADALLIATQLKAAIGPRKMPRASVWSPDLPRRR